MQQPPFHNSNREPLPDANDIEAEFQGKPTVWHQDDPNFQLSAAGRSRLAADKRWLRNFIVGLLLTDLPLWAAGGGLSVGHESPEHDRTHAHTSSGIRRIIVGPHPAIPK